MKLRVALLLLAAPALAVGQFSDVAVTQGRTPFMVYDNMFYHGKPNATAAGFVVSNIIYENKIWPHEQDYGRMPNRDAFAALVRSHASNPGPLVIDIGKMPLKGSVDLVRHHAEKLATLADWAHEASPGKVIGFYGTNTLSKVPPESLSYAPELARHVDAFFPPVYTFDNDREAYEKRGQESFAEARSLDPKKPIYFCLWPQYHDGTPKQFQFIDVSYCEFQPIASAMGSCCRALAGTTGMIPPVGLPLLAFFCTPRGSNCSDPGGTHLVKPRPAGVT